MSFEASTSDNFETANSYLSISEVEDFRIGKSDEFIFDRWGELSDTHKQHVLKRTAVLLDGYGPFFYDKTDENQFLEFPRDGSTEIPDCVKYACFEIFKCLILDTFASNMKAEVFADIERENFDKNVLNERVSEYMVKYINRVQDIRRYYN